MIQRLVCRVRGHRYRYAGTAAVTYLDTPNPTPFTGYIERCDRCGAIMQVPQ